MGQGTLQQILDWVTSDAEDAPSCSDVVAKSGDIYEVVPSENAPWCNGVDLDDYDAYKSDLSIDWLAQCWRERYSPNLVTVSYEHEGFAGEPLTEPQYQSTLWLHRRDAARFGIPIDRQHIVGHCVIDAINRPGDPGSAFPWDRLLRDLG